MDLEWLMTKRPSYPSLRRLGAAAISMAYQAPIWKVCINLYIKVASRIRKNRMKYTRIYMSTRS